MFNLPSDYVLSHKLLIEPRLQAGFTIKSHTEGGVPVSNTFRIGYGEENKLPTLDMLYPDKLYRDFVVLNAYYQQPDRDHLIVNTYIHNPINPLLTENKNRKIEIGWDFVYNGFEASISGFSEESKGGFSYFSEYYPIGFMRYVNLKHTVVSGRPTKDDYNRPARAGAPAGRRGRRRPGPRSCARPPADAGPRASPPPCRTRRRSRRSRRRPRATRAA